jgi:hypothetical protein
VSCAPLMLQLSPHVELNCLGFRRQLREAQLCAADPRTAANGAVRVWLRVEVDGAGSKVPLKAYRFEGTRGPAA